MQITQLGDPDHSLAAGSTAVKAVFSFSHFFTNFFHLLQKLIPSYTPHLPLSPTICLTRQKQAEILVLTLWKAGKPMQGKIHTDKQRHKQTNKDTNKDTNRDTNTKQRDKHVSS